MKFFIFSQVIGIATAYWCGRGEIKEYIFTGDLITEDGMACTAFEYNTKFTISASNLQNLSLVTSFGDLLITDISVGKLNSLKGLENVVKVESLEIIGAINLTSLEGLNNLKTIEKRIIISYNYKLENINALSLITSAYSISIDNNDKLENLNGLNNIENIQSNLEINNNDNLKNLNDLKSLKNIGTLTIRNNDKLENLNIFNFITSINSIIIRNNDKLENLNGLNNIENIKILEIKENDNLNSITEFNKLKQINGSIIIDENDNLNSITGFNSLSTINDFDGLGYGNLQIRGNWNIKTITGFNKLQSLDGYILIEKNYKLELVTFLGSIKDVEKFYFFDIDLYYLCQMSYSFKATLEEYIGSSEGLSFDSILSLINYCSTNTIEPPTPSPTLSPTELPTFTPTFTPTFESKAEFPVLPVVGGLIGVLGLGLIGMKCMHTTKKDEDLPVINSPNGQVVPVL